MVYHYRGGTDLVVSTRDDGLPLQAGQTKAGYLWDAEVGGNRYGGDAVFDDNGGTGGQVIAPPGGRLSFTMDETLGAKECWLDLGANERWRLRSWESYGPQGDPGPTGPPGSGLPWPLPSGTAADGSIPVLSGGATIWTDPSTIIGGGGSAGGYEGAAPGSILRWPTPDQADQVLPRPTSRLDVVIRWYLPTAPPEGNGYAIPGIDEWVDTSA